MPAEPTISHHPRQVIEDKLLAALGENSNQVAILCTKEDLELIIRALDLAPNDCPKTRQFAKDLRLLFFRAFPPFQPLPPGDFGDYKMRRP